MKQQASPVLKISVNTARILVGILFIFSGLVKANDPAGLSFKMHEFFEAWGMSSLNNMALPFAVLMNVFEIVAGVALLLGWRIRLFIWLLLLLIIFFTFLTGYAWLATKPDGSPRFKSCGCFGDCIPLNPKQSFYKDVLLLALIAFIMAFQRYIKPLFSNKISLALLAVALIASFGFQKYTLDHLPVKDCLSFKAGNNIAEKRKYNAPKKEIVMVHKKNGKEYSYTVPNYPEWFLSGDTTYVFDRREEKILSAGNEGDMIIDFGLRAASGTDTTEAILNQQWQYCFWFINDVPKTDASWGGRFAELLKTAQAKNIPVYVVTNQTAEAEAFFNGRNKWNLPVFFCDEKPILAAARTRPCLYLVDKGVIMNKWSFKDLGKSIRKIESLKANE